ncbi:hypothetical protein [Kineosporia babensis]|uniref:Uncharacterized protein n=1 Tax=Kineosporia babensis TaxID=499548 RepID=A0A9X1N9C4_9ACTN|nr:hypothetical protein [Kineosporia babensis]MCD5309953.1 hypothetical protein [Kineosporia babensis]
MAKLASRRSTGTGRIKNGLHDLARGIHPAALSQIEQFPRARMMAAVLIGSWLTLEQPASVGAVATGTRAQLPRIAGVMGSAAPLEIPDALRLHPHRYLMTCLETR